jgi:hypothetical protein
MEPLIDSLACDLSTNGTKDGFLGGRHFLDNPKYLPCCNRKACNKCVLKCLTKRRLTGQHHPEIFFNCPWCKKSSKLTMNGDECNLESDDYARDEYEKNLVDINHYLIKKLETNMKNVEGIGCVV